MKTAIIVLLSVFMIGCSNLPKQEPFDNSITKHEGAAEPLSQKLTQCVDHSKELNEENIKLALGEMQWVNQLPAARETGQCPCGANPT
jgi:hypothetical protein